jgi:hypothetical protein
MAASTQRAGTITPVNNKVICGGGSGVAVGVTVAVLIVSGTEPVTCPDRITMGNNISTLVVAASGVMVKGIAVLLAYVAVNAGGKKVERGTSVRGSRHPHKITQNTGKKINIGTRFLILLIILP